MGLAASNRDEFSLESVYDSHRQGLYSMALSVTGSRALAEDAIQEGFAKLVRHRNSASGLPVATSEGLVPYVFMTVRNSAIDLQRKANRQKKLADSLFNGYSPPANHSMSPPQDMLTRERDQILRDAIETLPEEQRDAVVLKAFGGLTFEQAAAVLDIPPKTLATRYRRALKKLETRLEELK